MNEDKMNFEDFKDAVMENIRDYLPENYRDARVSIDEFQKLNESYTGMQVRTEGQVIVPNINLDAHYAAFKRSSGELAGLDSVLHSIAQQVQSQLSLDTEWLKDYSQVKDRLYIRVSDAQQNAYALGKAPHREVDGLALSYHIAFEGRNGIQASTPVTNSLMEMYGITEEQLHSDAMASTQEILPARFENMAKIMGRMMGVDESQIEATMDGPQLMVLTNDQALHGAGALFYPGMMDSIAQQVGSDYFVLPSSIHECLILPDDGSVEADVLEAMVQDINMTTVAPEEQLSDHVYHYDAKDHVLEKAETFAARMELKQIEAEKASLQKAMSAVVKDASKAEALHSEASLSAKPPAPEGHEQKDSPAGRKKHEKEDARPERSGARRMEAPKKERRSVLARLSEKKEQAKIMPKKEAPGRSREAAI